jgi:hypothetical protein
MNWYQFVGVTINLIRSFNYPEDIFTPFMPFFENRGNYYSIDNKKKSWFEGTSFYGFYEMTICFTGFGFASSLFGMFTRNMPFSYFAPIWSLSAVLGRVNERLKDW